MKEDCSCNKCNGNKEICTLEDTTGNRTRRVTILNDYDFRI